MLQCLLLTWTAVACADNTAATVSPTERQRPPELGQIRWVRDFDAAATSAGNHRKPMIVLFQEVPGCQTCLDYGEQVLSHPLLVEAAETLFVPVAIYNNVKGNDERVLKSFKEKSWNNPVVRIIAPDRTSLAPRVGEDYTVAGLAGAMVKALENSKRSVPPYLSLLARETEARRYGLERATFAMHCFWEGELALGKVDGVLSTVPGFIDRDEVVEVEFDPRRISYGKLLDEARRQKCASRVYARSDAQHKVAAARSPDGSVRSDQKVRVDKEPKYYLYNTEFRFLPMTAMQASRINKAIFSKQDPLAYLSAGQRRLLEKIRSSPDAGWPSAVGVEFRDAWTRAAAVVP